MVCPLEYQIDDAALVRYPSAPTDPAGQMARITDSMKHAEATAALQAPAITARQRLGFDPMTETADPPAQE